MLDKLRNNINSIFSKLFLLILAASFALWGVGDIFSPKQDPTLAEVGHLEVTANEFITTYQRILSELNSNTKGNFTDELARSLGLPNQTLNQLINEKIYDTTLNFHMAYQESKWGTVGRFQKTGHWPLTTSHWPLATSF